MPQLQALTCPICAAPLTPDSDTCGFCGSFIVIKTDLPRLDRSTLNQSVIHEHIGNFRQRVRSNSYDEEAHYGLGVAYFNLGLLDESVDELTQAARLMPENPHIQAQLAVVLHDAYKAGNGSAEPEMQARIDRALLLDSTNLEASLLKAEVLAEGNQLQEAVSVLQGIESADRERVQARLASVLHQMGQKKLVNREWSEAQWCWQRLAPIDSSQAKDLGVRFLNLNRELVPRKFTPGSQVKQQSSVKKNLSRGMMTIIWAAVGFVVGVIAILIIASTFPENSDGTTTMSGWGALLIIVLFFGSPVGAAFWYWKKSGKSQDAPLVSPDGGGEKISRDHLLRGEVSATQALAAADTVVARVLFRQNLEHRTRPAKTGIKSR